jgi:hypothetical protein
MKIPIIKLSPEEEQFRDYIRRLDAAVKAGTAERVMIEEPGGLTGAIAAVIRGKS